MAIERTLSIIKPDAVAKNVIGQIYTRFETAGLKIVAARMMHLSRAEAEGFYAVHRERPFFKDLVDFMISGPVVVQALEGENAIAKHRELMGATDPKKADKGTIRADFADSIDANAVHGATAIRAALPHFGRTGGGSVVLVSSVSGWKPSPPAQYAAAKAAVIHMGACLARELGPAGVRVNVVCPGSMLIPGRRWERMMRDDPEGFERFAGEFPAGRLIDPDDVAAVIAFLLSDQARAVNGASIPVDAAQNAPSADGY